MGKLLLRSAVVGAVGTNCYFLKNSETNELVIIDPADNLQMIDQGIQALGAVPKAILLTHGHFDHILAANDLRDKYDISIYAPMAEKEVLMDPSKNQSNGWSSKPCTVNADVWVNDKEMLCLAGFEIEVLLTPGHTQGSTCYYLADEKTLISGDTLFCESVGRTDLPTGSMGTLVESVRTLLSGLPEDVHVYPGHGDITNIGHEKKYNPFV